MRRDQTVARIILVLSIVHGALAAPMEVRQRYLPVGVVEDVIAGSEKRSSDESPHPGSEVARDEMGDSYFTARSSLSSSNGYLTTPVSGAQQLHNDPQAGSGTLQTRDDQPGTSGTQPSQDHPLAGSGAPPTQDHPLAGSGTPQSQDHPLAGSGFPPSDDDPPPASGTPQLHSNPPPTSGAPSSQNNLSPASGDPQLHNDPTTSRLGTPQVHDDLSPGDSEFDESYRYLNGYRFPGATPPGSSQSEGSQPMSGTQQTVESEANRDFNGARNENLKLYASMIAFLGVTGGIVYGLNKLWGDDGGREVAIGSQNVSEPVGRDLASSDVVDPGASMHPRSPQKNGVAYSC